MTEGTNNRLRQLRERRGLSLEQVAATLGTTASTMGRWERGLVQIPDRLKPRLATFYEVSVTHMMRWDEDRGEAA